MSEPTTIASLIAAGVMSLGDGYRTRQSELRPEGFRIIRVADVQGGMISLESPDFVSAKYGRQIGPKAARAGDVVLTTKGTVGRVAIVPKIVQEAVYSPQLCWFRVSKPHVLNPRFLSYWLISEEFISQASYLQDNTDMAPYISLTDLRKSAITLPEPGVQLAIAEVLGALDDKIAANTALVDVAWALLDSEFRLVQASATSSHRLADIASFEYGKALPTSSRVPGPVAVVGSGGISGAHSKALVDKSGVVVGRKGTSGSVHWISGPHFPIDTTFYVKGVQDVHSQPYLYFLLRGLRLDEMNSDSAVPGLNRAEALALGVRVPTDDGLREFSRKASCAIDFIEALEHENRTLAATRDALLPQLMSGKLRVRDAEAAASAADA